jgi:hypothetical protein
MQGRVLVLLTIHCLTTNQTHIVNLITLVELKEQVLADCQEIQSSNYVHNASINVLYVALD